jgi:hypothetical protein
MILHKVYIDFFPFILNLHVDNLWEFVLKSLIKQKSFGLF